MSSKQLNTQKDINASSGKKYSQGRANVQAEQHEEHHVEVGEYIKSMVYGGLDGAINILVIILSGYASSQTPYDIMVIGIAATVGDCLGMGLGDYLSLKAQNQFILNQQKRQFDEVQNRLDDELQEVIEIYEAKGYSEKQALKIAELYSTNTKAFVNIMMLQELGLVVSDVEEWKCGLVTLIAFFFCGIIPLIPYIITAGIIKNDSQLYGASIGIGAVEFFSLGFAKGHIIQAPNLKKLYSGFESLVFGAAVVAAGYGVGLLFPE